MKNFVQPGDVVSVTAPYTVTSGGGVLVGTLFGFAAHDAASGAAVEIATTGVFTHAKAGSQAWTQGAAIYWDNSAKVLTTTSTSNTLVGKAMAAVAGGAGDTTGTVRLNG